MDEIINTLLQLLKEKHFSQLQGILLEMNPVDIAILLGEVPPEKLPPLFRLLPKELAAETFVEMDGDEQELLIRTFSDFELKEVIDELYLDDTVDLIEEMPANVVKRILKNVDHDVRQTINTILNYPKDSAGSIMTIEYVDLKKFMTVADAFKRIRRTGVDKETIYTCYVTDENRKLLGLLSVKTLLLADQNETINDIMETNVISVNTLTDNETVARLFEKYNLLAVPVVDQENRLVGIITVDDVLDVIREETAEDFAKMSAMQQTEDSYLKTPVWVHAKNRILWLLILMLSATVTGSIINQYQSAFETIPLLVAFIPMLMSTGGNCGSQSSTTVIRGLATDDIRLRDFFRVFWKESRIALLVSVTLSFVNFIRVMIQYQDFQLASVISLALIATVFVAKSLGCIMPMVAKKINVDPAIMASPIITTIVDACSVLIYFAIATHIYAIHLL